MWWILCVPWVALGSLSMAASLSHNESLRSHGRRTNKPCLISQYGKDGMGHQFEGKLSCMFTDLVTPQFEYLHQPMTRVEHAHTINATIGEIQRFFALGHLFASKAVVESGVAPRGPNGQPERKYNSPFTYQPPQQWWNAIYQNRSKCDPMRIQVVDNCWFFMYYAGINMVKRDHWSWIYLRDTFHAALTTYTLEPGRFNVVVHLRVGDGTKMPTEDTINAIYLYNKVITEELKEAPLFWIECETRTHPTLDILRKTYPTQIREHEQNGALHAFQRMTQADGLIIAVSSFSNAAYLLNNRTKPGVVNAIQNNLFGKPFFRTPWYKSDDFIYLSNASLPTSSSKHKHSRQLESILELPSFFKTHHSSTEQQLLIM